MKVKSARRDAAQNLLDQLRQHDRTFGMASPSDPTLQNLRVSSSSNSIPTRYQCLNIFNRRPLLQLRRWHRYKEFQRQQSTMMVTPKPRNSRSCVVPRSKWLRRVRLSSHSDTLPLSILTAIIYLPTDRLAE